jgi:exodeoxyribonuclease VII small subunit
VTEPSFETSLSELEGVVRRLERGELSLADSFTAYEQGMRLVQQAQQALQSLEAKLEQLNEAGTSSPLAQSTPSDGQL